MNNSKLDFEERENYGPNKLESVKINVSSNNLERFTASYQFMDAWKEGYSDSNICWSDSCTN